MCVCVCVGASFIRMRLAIDGGLWRMCRARLFVLKPLFDVHPTGLDQRVQLGHEGDEPHQVAADEGDDERRAPGPADD